jgi:hypothetical protein
VRMERADARNGKVVWRRCSRVTFIGRGRLAGAAEERSWRRPVEFNGAAVLSLESSPRGRGNGGVASLRKEKWRQHGLGRGGGAQRDSSRSDGRRRLGRPREGNDARGGLGRSGWVGRMPLGPVQRENIKKRDGPQGRLGQNDFGLR